MVSALIVEHVEAGYQTKMLVSYCLFHHKLIYIVEIKVLNVMLITKEILDTI